MALMDPSVTKKARENKEWLTRLVEKWNKETDCAEQVSGLHRDAVFAKQKKLMAEFSRFAEENPAVLKEVLKDIDIELSKHMGVLTPDAGFRSTAAIFKKMFLEKMIQQLPHETRKKIRDA